MLVSPARIYIHIIMNLITQFSDQRQRDLTWGATVIDVETNVTDEPNKKSGYRLVGDDDFLEACKS